MPATPATPDRTPDSDSDRTPDSDAERARRRSSKRVPDGAEQLTVYVPREVANAARNAVVATTPYSRGYQALSALVADAISEKVARLEKQFNNGAPFPQRRGGLRRGRPLQSAPPTPPSSSGTGPAAAPEAGQRKRPRPR